MLVPAKPLRILRRKVAGQSGQNMRQSAAHSRQSIGACNELVLPLNHQRQLTEQRMKIKRELCASVAVIAVASAFMLAAPVRAQQAARVSISDTDIGGVVTGPRGPEAGVWVIAETTDLPAHMIKIVVTDEQGRYIIPELPQANYMVWARGYGLVDSAKTRTEPGKIINIGAIPAPNEAAAAEYYPAIYWYSMLNIPDKSMFPGTGPNGNGMNPQMKSQLQWLDRVKSNSGVRSKDRDHQADPHLLRHAPRYPR
jgi:hypothetical protein